MRPLPSEFHFINVNPINNGTLFVCAGEMIVNRIIFARCASIAGWHGNGVRYVLVFCLLSVCKRLGSLAKQSGMERKRKRAADDLREKDTEF